MHVFLPIIAHGLDCEKLWRDPLEVHLQSLRYLSLPYKLLKALEMHVACSSFSEILIVEEREAVSTGNYLLIHESLENLKS